MVSGKKMFRESKQLDIIKQWKKKCFFGQLEKIPCILIGQWEKIACHYWIVGKNHQLTFPVQMEAPKQGYFFDPSLAVKDGIWGPKRFTNQIIFEVACTLSSGAYSIGFSAICFIEVQG